jgi:hypothetical protein
LAKRLVPKFVLKTRQYFASMMLCKTVLPMLHPSPYLLLILINLTATKSEAEAWVAIQTNVSISFTSETHSKKHYLGARARALLSRSLISFHNSSFASKEKEAARLA